MVAIGRIIITFYVCLIPHNHASSLLLFTQSQPLKMLNRTKKNAWKNLSAGFLSQSLTQAFAIRNSDRSACTQRSPPPSSQRGVPSSKNVSAYTFQFSSLRHNRPHTHTGTLALYFIYLMSPYCRWNFVDNIFSSCGLQIRHLCVWECCVCVDSRRFVRIFKLPLTLDDATLYRNCMCTENRGNWYFLHDHGLRSPEYRLHFSRRFFVVENRSSDWWYNEI